MREREREREKASHDVWNVAGHVGVQFNHHATCWSTNAFTFFAQLLPLVSTLQMLPSTRNSIGSPLLGSRVGISLPLSVAWKTAASTEGTAVGIACFPPSETAVPPHLASV